jgi:uncharacterized protein (DUF1499 family)
MKYVKLVLIFLIVFILGVLITLSVYSRFVEPPTLENGKLKPCKSTRNCVCSENYPNRNFQPIEIDTLGALQQWKILKSAIIEAGGEIVTEKEKYVHAKFVTPLFRFVDDFEARLDLNYSVIHLRSASRVGNYDYGTNMKRVKNILEIFQNKM